MFRCTKTSSDIIFSMFLILILSFITQKIPTHTIITFVENVIYIWLKQVWVCIKHQINSDLKYLTSIGY